MTEDLEQKARETWGRIVKQRQLLQGGYDVPRDEPPAWGFILEALREVREAAAKEGARQAAIAIQAVLDELKGELAP